MRAIGDVLLAVVMGFGLSGWLVYVAKTGKGLKHPTPAKRRWCGILAALTAALVLFAISLEVAIPDSSRSTPQTPSLSTYTRQKIFYDLIAVQDQNPDSNEWNQQAKQAAAQTYRVPLSTIDEIIREGATKGWMQPDPP